MRRRFTLTAAVLLVLVAATPLRAQGVNAVAVSGTVDAMLDNWPFNVGLLAVRIATDDGTYVIFECHAGAPTGCDQLVVGDHVLVYGKLGQHQSCNIFGSQYGCILPSVVYRCAVGARRCQPLSKPPA